MAQSITTITIPLKDGSRCAITAARTAVQVLAITPALIQADDGTVTLDDGILCLRHIPTGRRVVGGSHRRLDELATRLAQFSWDFTDPNYFRNDANKDELGKIKAVIREWEMAEDSGMPIGFSGDSDEMIAARQAAPAATLLREQINSFSDTQKRLRDLNFEDNRELWMATVAYSCEAHGVIYLLGVLRAIDPTVADAAARDLVGAWECGEFAEWVYQWGQELAAGKPLTLHGIPNADSMADFT